MTSPASVSSGAPEKRMAWKVIDRLFLVAYGKAPPTDEEWQTYLHDIEMHGIERTMQIIVTEGGAPTAIQRRYLGDLVAGRFVPVVVLCDDPTIRSIIRAMAWINGNLRAFPLTSLLDALVYLRIPKSRGDLIDRELAELRGMLKAANSGGGAS